MVVYVKRLAYEYSGAADNKYLFDWQTRAHEHGGAADEVRRQPWAAGRRGLFRGASGGTVRPHCHRGFRARQR